MRPFALLLLLAWLGGCTQQPDLPPGVFQATDLLLDQAAWDQPRLAGDSTLPKGKFIALLWASWCPTCRAEHPYVMQLAQRGVPLVGITFKDASADSLAFIDRFGNPFRILLDDSEGKLASKLGGDSTPIAFVFNHQHRLRGRIIGGLNQRRWERQGLGEWFTELE